MANIASLRPPRGRPPWTSLEPGVVQAVQKVQVVVVVVGLPGARSSTGSTKGTSSCSSSRPPWSPEQYRLSCSSAEAPVALSRPRRALPSTSASTMRRERGRVVVVVVVVVESPALLLLCVASTAAQQALAPARPSPIFAFRKRCSHHSAAHRFRTWQTLWR